MWPRSGLKGERPCDSAPDDDPEGVDDRHAQDEQGDRDLRGAEDGRAAPGRSPTNWTPVVPMKIDAGWKFQRRNPTSAPGEDEAEDRDERLAPRAVVRLISAEGDRGDQRDARRQAVEAVDEVDAVDHADDPEDGERRRRRRLSNRIDPAGPNGLAMKLRCDPERDGDQRRARSAR